MWRIQRQPRRSAQSSRRLTRHKRTTIPLLMPLSSRAKRFLSRHRPVAVVAPIAFGGKLDGNAFHLIGIAGNEARATGEWIETGPGKNGELITIKGYWSDIYVREGDDWKIRVTAWNETPDSVLLINKNFPQQLTATPSPTASPSSQ